jgi:hypothetical protein
MLDLFPDVAGLGHLDEGLWVFIMAVDVLVDSGAGRFPSGREKPAPPCSAGNKW